MPEEKKVYIPPPTRPVSIPDDNKKGYRPPPPPPQKTPNQAPKKSGK